MITEDVRVITEICLLILVKLTMIRVAKDNTKAVSLDNVRLIITDFLVFFSIQ